MLSEWSEDEANWFERIEGVNWNENGVGFDGIDAKSTSEDSDDWYNDDPSWKTFCITGLTQKWIDGTAKLNYS